MDFKKAEEIYKDALNMNTLELSTYFPRQHVDKIKREYFKFVEDYYDRLMNLHDRSECEDFQYFIYSCLKEVYEKQNNKKESEKI